jgi:tetratricopeptide (TPR) repeat protein
MRGSDIGLGEILGRVAVSVCVFGSSVALCVVSYGAVRTLAARDSIRNQDEYVRANYVRTDIFTPVEQRISDQEAMIQRLQDPIIIQEEQRKLATLYQELGQRNLAMSRLSRAEEAYHVAAKLDPNNPQYISDVAILYATAAAQQREREQRVALFVSSSEYWQSAINLERDPARRKKWSEGAANAAYMAARELRQAGRRVQAINELSKARVWAPSGSNLQREIEALFNQISQQER